MARLDELLDTPPAVRDQPGAARLSRASGHIRIRQLTFRYDEAGPVALDKVDLEAPPGVTVGVLGRTGSGKSTLAQLLVRVFDPPPESVHLDGVDITTVRLADLRRSIAYVPQDAFLFSRTIAENIALGAETCTADDVRRATRAADLEDDIEALPFAYDTLVGERGVTLSGGQRQRVAIARALVRNAPVLVLDDCLSAVDTATEARILEALRAHSAERTTIVISHRVSALRHADEILVLEAGRVVERGRHDDLVAFGGVYARTYERQQLEVALEVPATVGSPR
jgi:ATP-binding cassette subfamily B protein